MFLLDAPEASLQQVGDRIGQLEELGYIPDDDSDKVFDYLDSIAEGKEPEIPYLTYLHGPTAHPKAVNAVKLAHALQKISFMKDCLIRECWNDLRTEHQNSLQNDA